MLFNVQTAYSLLQSTLRIGAYIQRAKTLGYQAIGIADINAMHGAVEFYQSCVKNNLKALIGMTLQTKGLLKTEKDYSMLLYAKNYQGYQELLTISKTLSSQNVTTQQIFDYIRESTHYLVLITTGQQSELEESLFLGDFQQAERILRKYREIVGYDNVYLGVTAYPYQSREIKVLQTFATQHALKLVANQRVNMLEAQDYFSLKVLGAIHRNDTLELSLREMNGTNYLYSLVELEQMYQLAHCQTVIDESHHLIEQLNVELLLNQHYLPKFQVPNQMSADEYLRSLIFEALTERSLNNDTVYVERANYELDVIATMGFSDYFLIVWEIVDFCRQNGIRIGPGRGSAAGALISYLLKITSVDPIQYDLLFERFLNPERKTMPDIDLDVPDNQRDRILTHIEQKYGSQFVAQIGTMGTFGAKQAMRDTLRVLSVPKEMLAKWSKAIPTELAMNLEKAYLQSAPLRALVNQSPQNQAIYQVARNLEGLPRHVSTHAAGVIIHDAPLVSVIPVLERPHQMLLSQLTMYDVESVGLLKLDILGLRNLSLLEDIVQNIYQQTNEQIDVSNIPLDDEPTLALFRKANTKGVFQFESDGIRNVLRKLAPTSFEDIVAVNALYRPGPKDQIEAFIRNKKEPSQVTYLHPVLASILQATYGIIVYQEQVMQICRQLAGFTYGQADILRRAMSKKQVDVMASQRINFIEGAKQNGVDEQIAKQIYQYIDAFASYGFNRSHAVVYSMLAYQLAYLKVHYPLAFYQAIINQGRSSTTSLLEYIDEVKKQFGTLLPIHINESERLVTVNNGVLRLGFDGVKGLRKELMDHILQERKAHGLYQDVIDFLARLPQRFLKTDTILPLIQIGALDGFGYNRATLAASLENFMQSVAYQGINYNLFEDLKPKVELREEWSSAQIAQYEKDLLGFSLAPHPLQKYREVQAQLDDLSTLSMSDYKKKVRSLIYCQDMRIIETKKGDTMAFMTIDAGKEKQTVVVFPELFMRKNHLMQRNRILYLEGQVDKNLRGELQIIANKLEDVEFITSKATTTQSLTKCYIRLQATVNYKEAIERVQSLAQTAPGPCRIIFVTPDKKTWQLDDAYQISYSHAMQAELKAIFGEANIVYQ